MVWTVGGHADLRGPFGAGMGVAWLCLAQLGDAQVDQALARARTGMSALVISPAPYG
jgi:hypothetical protein